MADEGERMGIAGESDGGESDVLGCARTQDARAKLHRTKMQRRTASTSEPEARLYVTGSHLHVPRRYGRTLPLGTCRTRPLCP